MTDKEIAAKLLDIAIRLLKTNTLFENKVAKLSKEKYDIQKQCPHNKTTYHPDPSGNNDSCVICDVCEKELTREEWRS